MLNNAFVNIWNKRVGAVSWDREAGLGSFQFDKDFLKTGLELSPLLMPINQGERIFEFPENRENTTFKGLPGLLADILPDKYGNALINTWLARQGRPTVSLNPVETDFTVEYKRKSWYWEHLGLLGQRKYVKTWKEIKRPTYEKFGLWDQVINTDETNGITPQKIEEVIDLIISDDVNTEDDYNQFSNHHFYLR